MRSFRLDPDSVTELFNSWPAFVIAPLLVCLFAYLGITHLWGRVCAVFMCGIFGGSILRGVTAHRFREQYPGARWFWLLTVGQTSLVVGVTTMLAFPHSLGTPLDLAWLGMSFFSILLFVLINRKNRNVVR
jgi:hypothetical protein